MKSVILHQKIRKKGSYYRKDFRGDVLYYTFIYQDLHITFAKKGRKNTILNDFTADLLLSKNLISKEDLLQYKNKVASLFSLETLPDFDEYSLEDLYDFVAQIRKNEFGKDLLNKLWHILARESKALEFENCLDQREQILKTCCEKETLLIALTEPELLETMLRFTSNNDLKNKNIVFITSENHDKNLPSERDLKCILGKQNLQTVELKDDLICCDATLFDPDNSVLLIFGESGLLDARNLILPCGVFCRPRGYHASAVAGQLGLSRPAAVFIPKGFTVIENVPVTKPTRLTFLTIAKLSKEHGDKVYSLSTNELYAAYPKFFFNVYESNVSAGEEESLEIQIPDDQNSIDFDSYDLLRSQVIKEHLNSFPGCQYYTKVFTEDVEGIKGKILVHGVRIKKSNFAAVIPCGKTMPLRSKMREMNENGTGIVSNFLFFLTPKLATLYNDLRSDRPEEQANVDAYLLEFRDGNASKPFRCSEKPVSL